MATIRERVRQDGTRVYNVQVRIGGFPDRTATFTTADKAKRWARTIEGEMEDGRHFRNAEAKRRTLSDAVDRFIRDDVPELKSGDDYASKLNWWKAQLGHLKLADITPALVVEYRDRLRRETRRGKKISNATVNRYVAYLSSMFKKARRNWRWTDRNPVDVDKFKEQRRDRYLSDAEHKALFAEIAKDSTLHTFAIIALSTACRAGELQKLRWADVDLKVGQLLFRDPKNTHSRTAWVRGLALDLLKEHAKVRPIDGDALVFSSTAKNGGAAAYRYYPEYCKAVAVAKIKNLKFHDLRHTAATWLARDGATGHQLKAIGGWKSDAMVATYVNLAAMDTKAVVNRLAEKIAGT